MLLFNNSDIHIPIYNRLKVYPTFMRLYKFNSPSIERLEGFEDRKKYSISSQHTLNSPEDSLYRSLRRTKTTISDLVLSNQFDIFVTFTFKKDRQNIEKSKQKMSNWLKSQQKLHNQRLTKKYLKIINYTYLKSIHTHSSNHQINTTKFFIRTTDLHRNQTPINTRNNRNTDPESEETNSKTPTELLCDKMWISQLTKKQDLIHQLIHSKPFTYLIVPEFHKDKKSLHFHALFNNYMGKLVDSGKLINKRKAYNLPSYKSGFNSAIKIDNHHKVSSYVRKYITKDMPQFDGKKRYWISTGLKRPFTDVNVQLLNAPFINWSKTYTSNNLEIYETSDTLKILSNHEKEITWQTASKNLQTLQNRESLQQSLLIKEQAKLPVIPTSAYFSNSRAVMRR